MKRFRQSNDILENKNKYIINCKIEWIESTKKDQPSWASPVGSVV